MSDCSFKWYFMEEIDLSNIGRTISETRPWIFKHPLPPVELPVKKTIPQKPKEFIKGPSRRIFPEGFKPEVSYSGRVVGESEITYSERSAQRNGFKTNLMIGEYHYIRCYYCNKLVPLIKITKDHKLAKSKGGTNKRENIVPACRGCNTDKGSQSCLEYVQFRHNNGLAVSKEALREVINNSL
jgi:5-methylcytosine-specific restriction endonuclease McrA